MRKIRPMKVEHSYILEELTYKGKEIFFKLDMHYPTTSTYTYDLACRLNSGGIIEGAKRIRWSYGLVPTLQRATH